MRERGKKKKENRRVREIERGRSVCMTERDRARKQVRGWAGEWAGKRLIF